MQNNKSTLCLLKKQKHQNPQSSVGGIVAAGGSCVVQPTWFLT